ncbi:uncharacterized protein TNCT_361811 [Trichonephila clavata]|uniref:Uncharacterized protein n=1 Tax=Trichonephila clavata TaxID=2740835 RepID=A0A8X6KXV7_TRICU|nr:uncharacterized protein TNCT_361811 [Trichonephila clavata]
MVKETIQAPSDLVEMVTNQLFPNVLFDHHADQLAFNIAMGYVACSMDLKTAQVKKGAFAKARRLYGINQWINTHTPVDPEVAKVIVRYIHKHDGIESILAQDFVKNEWLNRLIQNMVKSGQSNTISTLLAIDGLIGPKLNNGPQFESKKYLENLKYSLSGEQGRYDRGEDDLVKRTHVFAIRRVYKELENHQSDENVDSKLMNCVYQVMSSMLKVSAGLELPKGPGIPLPDNVLKACSDVYWSNTSWEYFNRLVEILKSKIVVLTNNADSSTSNVEDGSAKKRKKEEAT